MFLPLPPPGRPQPLLGRPGRADSTPLLSRLFARLLQAGLAGLMLCLLVPVAPARAWSPELHGRLAAAAFASLAPEVQQALAPLHDALVAAAASADDPADPTAAAVAAQIAALLSAVEAEAGRAEPDLQMLAEDLGEMAHLAAQMSDPLQFAAPGSGPAGVAPAWQAAATARLASLPPSAHGRAFWADPSARTAASAERAAWFLPVVATAFSGGDGFVELAAISRLLTARAVRDIADLWMTAWARSAATSAATLDLAVNRSRVIPGDSLQLTLSSAAGRAGPTTADWYLAGRLPGAEHLLYLTADDHWSPQPTPWRTAAAVSALQSEAVADLLMPPGIPAGTLELYALLIAPGGSPFDAGARVSNLASLQVELDPDPALELADLGDEAYLLEAQRPEDPAPVVLPVRRWDVLFTGDLRDNPATAEDESWSNRVIPGSFNHALVYLGRDGEGAPWALEMTTSLVSAGADLRIIRLPEFETVPQAVEAYGLALGPKSLSSYRYHWARRLAPAERAAVQQAAAPLFARMQADWAAGFPYQLEFDWSGEISDLAIQLVDDGRERGASCTDYWLSLYEELAGVCIYGSRIDAAGVEAYFRSDPVGMTVAVPDAFNPFPFPLTVRQALNLGFHPVDPPPHVFPCDGSRETGVPIPDRLLQSPQLVEIGAVELGGGAPVELRFAR